MHFPSYLPRPLTSYLGGERPMAWFPLFPVAGLAAGRRPRRPLLGARSGDARKQAMAFVVTGLVGVAMMRAVVMVRAHNPYIIHYPSDLVQQMGPGTFFYRLGQIGPLALLAYLVTRHLPAPLVLADAALRADLAARLLGPRRARLRPPARPAAPPAQHVGRHGRAGPDDRGDGWGGQAAAEVLARLAENLGPQTGGELARAARSFITVEVMGRFHRPAGTSTAVLAAALAAALAVQLLSGNAFARHAPSSATSTSSGSGRSPPRAAGSPTSRRKGRW